MTDTINSSISDTLPAAPEAWYSRTPEEVATGFGVDPAVGLSAGEAARRLQQYGPNRMAAKQTESGLHAFVRQYRDFMQILLLSAAIVNVLVTAEWGTTIVLLLLTVFNAVLSLRGEAKAAASVGALEKMLKNVARVRRNGEAIEIDSEGLVPGDIVLMEAGNRVPADGRLFVAATLEIEEGALTGESVPVLKDLAAIEAPDVGIGDRHCLAFMNTSVTRGRGEMIVTTTGMGTEIGHIADLLNRTEADRTPLQKQLDRLTVTIAAIAGVAFVVMLLIGISNDDPFDTIFTAGIALAIAAIPCGLPAVVTTMYSMGTRALADLGAIVKRLPSVETLGSVSAVCSDKTGTLTLNKMTAREFVVPGQHRYKVTGEGYSTTGEFRSDGGPPVDLEAVLLPMALCADARLDEHGELIGDPTEGALIVLAAKGGLDLDGVRARYPRVAEVPFDSDYKFMATFHEMTSERGQPVVRCFVKGAPDVLISRGGSYWLPGGEVQPVTEANRHLALEENDRIAGAGERVMVVARRDFDPATFDPNADLIELVQDLTLLAMVGIVDPPRAEAKAAIAECHSAGIKVRMITGDHAVTAAAIGSELGIDGDALTGAEFAALSDEELAARLPDIAVVARVAPEDKVRLVRSLQAQGNIVSMTGDGVNDAPALKKADIGVAMGITGTEVSKEAAIMILTDDNFATIVKAVKYGRELYGNLSKFIRFQMTALVAFITSFLCAAIFSIAGGIPFSPISVLYINFIIQVPIAMALGFDRPLPDVMSNPPRPMSAPVLSRAQWVRIIVMGALIAVTTLAILNYADRELGTATGATMALVVFGLMEMAVGLGARSEFGTVFDRDVVGGRRQLMLFGLSFLTIVLASELGVLQRVLDTTSITGGQWLVCSAAAVGLVMIDELIKLYLRSQQARATADVI
jgi:Ca2+-transporting ATPase